MLGFVNRDEYRLRTRAEVEAFLLKRGYTPEQIDQFYREGGGSSVDGAPISAQTRQMRKEINDYESRRYRIAYAWDTFKMNMKGNPIFWAGTAIVALGVWWIGKRIKKRRK